MTGAYVRVKRAGEWRNIEFDQLTEDEIDEFSKRPGEHGWEWAKFLVGWIQDNVKEGPRDAQENQV